MSDTANLGFNKVRDVVYDSRVGQSLIDQGVFPGGFRVIKCTVDLEGLAIGAAVIQALVDDATGQQLQLEEGTQVVQLQAGTVEAVATAANLTLFQVGLAATSTGAVAETLSAVGTGTLLNAAGVPQLFNTNGGVVGATNQYVVLSTTVVTLALTAGVAQVTLIVV